MNIYKHGKLIAVSAIMLLGLSACNNNNDEALDLRDNKMTTMNNNGTGYWDNDTKSLRGQNGRRETSAVRKPNQNGGNGTSEILQMPNGYLTVDPNSYSTGIPSTRYPHTEMNRQGRMTYEDGQHQLANQPLSQDQSLLQPPTGTRQAPDLGITPNPDQGPLQAPNEGTAPTEQGAAPTPNQEAAPQQKAAPTPSGTEISAFESRVIDLTNEQRRKNGLQNLQPDTALSNVAQKKSDDMQAKNYFSHTSPTYGSPFDMMRDFGVSYSSAGENIAMGQPSAEEVVNAWMNSEGHRKNILSPNFTHIGVGHTGNGNYWTQMFIGKK
ncbi:CAP domain-containing protein [Bacillus sp. JJ1122]|uniref:CAP domain-containing protein n=1 Tax=Bacillus sp. JJ1122 TaxID=3122951 RepID=UPI002FFF7F2A